MKVSAVLLSMASVVASMCHDATHLAPRSEGLVRRADGTFGYHELAGPLNWNSISPAAAICATGTNQSPINVIPSQLTTVRGSSFGASIPNRPQGAEFLNLGTTVEILTTGSAKIGRKVYNLLQFHFHTPSEHHLNSGHYPAEVHFVFQAAGECLESAVP